MRHIITTCMLAAFMVLSCTKLEEYLPHHPDRVRPDANFTYTLSSDSLPVQVAFTNTSTGATEFYWDFGNGQSSTLQNPVTTYTEGGVYQVRLIASNAFGKDTSVQQITIEAFPASFPHPQTYTSFNNQTLNLYSWEGDYVTILSSDPDLNKATMWKWVHTMDSVYLFYKEATGRTPATLPPTYINNRTTIADVPTTCGAGCGYLGATGIELQHTFFNNAYIALDQNNEYDQVVFYEFGRNFWFYENKLAYKANDPVTTGYAIFMRFMAMEATGVKGASFDNLSFDAFKDTVIGLVDQYLANPSLTWENTLAIDRGVPNGFGSAADLFASFCFRLKRDYGGDAFVQNIWKEAALRPDAVTTQDAVDNFFLAACAAANRNLTPVFQNWRWPLSDAAIEEAEQYP
ncbi:MAG TPA: PKD domain-containing protein [Flavisolibacter sp.]|nr:PKD domain-containing protein [Flavisolibacter sp.]